MSTPGSGAREAAVMLPDDEIARIREELPAVRATSYLNAGTLGPLPRVAIEAMRSEGEYDEGRRQCERLWERLAECQQATREQVARLVGTPGDRVALMHATHEGINTCLWGLEPAAADTFVTTDEEHPGVLVPLRHVRDRTGATIEEVAWGSGGDELVAAIVERVEAADRPRAVIVSHVSWVTGRVAPLRALADALPDEVALVVDGAQSAGVVETSLDDGWDAYTVSGQKWPCGPNGSGGLALADVERWSPTYGGFLQVVDPGDCLGSELQPDGRRFETCQESMRPLAGLTASVGWLLDDVGLSRVRPHARACNELARERLLERGVVADEAALHGEDHLLCVDWAAGDAASAAVEMCRREISIRPLGDERLRLSFGCWTTPAEVVACVDELARLGPVTGRRS